MKTLLEKIHQELQYSRHEFLVLNETKQNSDFDEQSVDIAIAPVLGIYKLEVNGYQTTTGKNVQSRDYCWGHWRCYALDKVNSKLKGLFSPVAEGTSQDEYYFGEYKEGKGLRFRFEPGDLQPAKADLIENIERIQGWFEGKQQPDTLWLPQAVAREIVGVETQKISETYCLFPSYATETKARKMIRNNTTSPLERTITITCYPCREFYEEKEKLWKKKHQTLKRNTTQKSERERIEKYDRQLEDLGVILEDEDNRKINILSYNTHFQGKVTYY